MRGLFLCQTPAYMRLIHTLAILPQFLLILPVSAQWNALNAGSGNRSITTKSGAIYVAAPPAGVRKSTTEGATWTSANTGLPLSGANVMAQSVGSNSAAVFCGTESGVYRSTDNGASWISVNGTLPASSNTIYCNRIHTFNDAIFLVYTGQLSQNGGGVFRTFDNGTTWLQAFSGLASNMTVNMLAEYNGDLYAATSTGLMRSTDLGGSWQMVGTTNWTVQAVQGQNGALVILGAFGAQRSTDNGLTWTATTGYPTNNCPVGSDLIRYDGMFYAITKTGANGCYRSSDNGATWTAFNDGLSPQNTFAQEEFHASASHLYIACALDAYRIPSTTVSVEERADSRFGQPFPTLFEDRFRIDLTALDGMGSVVLIDPSGREAGRWTVTGNGIATIERQGLASGPYLCYLLAPSIEGMQPLGRVIAE